MINTINYMVNFYVNSKFIYGFSKAEALLGNYLCSFVTCVEILRFTIEFYIFLKNYDW